MKRLLNEEVEMAVAPVEEHHSEVESYPLLDVS